MAGLCGIVRPRGDDLAGPSIPQRRAGELLAALRRRGSETTVRQSPRAVLAACAWDGPELLWARAHGVWVVADARLDNRDELCRALDGSLTSGDHERTPTDATLVLAAYRRWGESFAARLLGDFAVAIWDSEASRLFLARDPLGIKPLHYRTSDDPDGPTAFASEAWTLAAGAEPNPDRLAAARYLIGRDAGRERSWFADVRPVVPGEVVRVGATGTRRTTFWDPAAAPRVRHRHPGDYAEELLELLRFSLRARTRDAGSVTGIAMSGGLDSCAVAALAVETAPGPTALSMTFEGQPFCDESPAIDAMEGTLGLPVERIRTRDFHHWARVESVGDAPPLVWEQAFAEMTRRLRVRGGSILLTGHGADDLLSGTPLMLAARLQQGDASVVREILSAARRHEFPPVRTLYRRLVRPFLPAAAADLLQRFGGPGGGAEMDWLHPDLTALLRDDRPPEPPTRRRARDLGRWQLLDTVRRLPGLHQSLTWIDRVASRAGVEIRHPFLDRRLVEWVLGVPPEMLFRLGEHKPLLRRAVGGLLPSEVLQRPDKAQLGDHVDACVRREWHEVAPWLHSPRLADLGLVRRDRLAARAGHPYGPPRDVYRPLFLEAWWRRRATEALSLRLDHAA